MFTFHIYFVYHSHRFIGWEFERVLEIFLKQDGKKKGGGVIGECPDVVKI